MGKGGGDVQVAMEVEVQEKEAEGKRVKKVGEGKDVKEDGKCCYYHLMKNISCIKVMDGIEAMMMMRVVKKLRRDVKGK